LFRYKNYSNLKKVDFKKSSEISKQVNPKNKRKPQNQKNRRKPKEPLKIRKL
jgi:hypothetical protein